MKLPSVYIAASVLLSLLGIFVYQTYWLTNLYHTRRQEMQHYIAESMRLSDYGELMLRVTELRKKSSQPHGTISVEAGYKADGGSYIHSSTQLNSTDSLPPGRIELGVHSGSEGKQYFQVTKSKDSIVVKQQKETENTTMAALATKGDWDAIVLSPKGMDIAELAAYFQRGIHAGMDLLLAPNVQAYDSLLAQRLHEMGVDYPYRLDLIRRYPHTDSTMSAVDTIGVGGTMGYVPREGDNVYEYTADMNEQYRYRLFMQPLTFWLLKQMAGILIASLVILLLLGVSFWFLIRTLLHLRSVEEMKRDFTNNVTHELKTPISIAYAANDALLNFEADHDEVRRKQYLRICRDQLQHLGQLVEQILSMSMERRQEFKLRKEPVALKPLLEELMEQHRVKAHRSARFVLEITSTNLHVHADRIHLVNILNNLLDNAVKYSPDKIEVTVTADIVQRNSGESKIRIRVSDKGLGMSANRLPHIFDKFYRIPTGNVHNVKGYGLGLYYVKTLVEKHGGSVSVESLPRQGSTFTLIL